MERIKKFRTPIFIGLGIVILCFIIFLVVKHTGKKEEHGINPMFAEYVSALTTGVISSEATIKIVLVEPYKGDSAKRDDVLKNIFDFSPNIKGAARWLDNRTIEFVPEKKLNSGEEYEAKFKLFKLVNVPEDLRILKFTFVVIKQDFTVNESGLHTYAGMADMYYLQGTIVTADAIENDVIEKVLTAKVGGKKLMIHWDHNGDRKEHTFTADSIKRKSQAQTLILSWEGKEADIEKTGKTELEVPATGVFKVLDTRQEYSPEKYLKIIFSDPLLQNQNLDGLITLDNISNLRFTIEDNIVKVYYEKVGESTTFNLIVNTGIQNYKGDPLPEKYIKQMRSEEIKPAVQIIGKGVIMPNSGDIVLPFMAVSLKAVDVIIVKIFENNIPQFLQTNNLNGVRELKRVGRPVYKGKIDLVSDHVLDLSVWNTFSIDLNKFIKADPGALYRVTFSFRRSYAIYPCLKDTTEKSSSDAEEINTEQNDQDFSDWDISENEYYGDGYNYYYESGYYEEGNYWENRDNPCYKAYYNTEKFPSCNILASNLGITAKVNKNNQINVIITDLNTAEPLSGISVDILDYQQQVMATASTNSDGFASIKTNHRPYLVIARNGKERGYLPLTGSSSLSLSTFDVGGDEVQKGLKGFIYGERGIWRPGDTVFLSFIIEDKNKTLPANHPVIFEVTDPNGRPFKRLVRAAGMNGFYTFVFATDENSPTGNWNVKIKAGGATFDKTIKIETIKPNRLEINLDVLGDKTFAESSLKGKLSAKWLTGAIAPDFKARISLTLATSTTSFKKYPNFIFDDPARNFTSEEQTIFDGQLDNNGEADISTSIAPNGNAPGMLKATFITKVFEESGDFSIDFLSVPFSPYDYYVGLQTPESDNWGGMLYTDTTQIIKVASVDANGSPVSRSNITVEVYRVEWRWWWDGSDDNLATYFANSSHTPVFEKTISTSNGSGKFALRIGEANWGRYLIKVKDQDGHSAGKIVYFDWPGWYSRSRENNQGGASILTIATDKQQYKVGEKAIVNIPSSGSGRALVSLESGSRIIDMFWMNLKKSKDNRASIEIPITAEMAPNVFINVTLLQPHDSTMNDAPLRLFGYTPILVEDPETRLDPEIKLPDVIGSEEPFNISVKEKNGKPMTYTLAIVDEGLLSLTRFKTPDPHGTFYAREALGIKTWDLFDLVFGAFGGKIEQMFAIGGDQELANMKSKKNAERFKPVVKFLGPFELGKGDKNSHNVKLPKYNGAVRVMLVAGQDGAYGNIEKSVKVKDALMVMATMPRVLGPTETVTIPVTVFADDGSVKNVKVEVQTNNLLIPADEMSKNVSFRRPGTEVVNFTMKVAKAIGIARVKIIAASGKYKADYEIELNVRNPNPPAYEYSGTIIQGGQQYNQVLEMIGMPGTNKASVEVSTLPPIDLNRRLSWLIHYPYGCIEQTTSSVFPQLYLNDILDLSKDKLDEIEVNVKAGVNRVKEFQTKEGGLSYWPGEGENNEWASNYGGHFMIEAEAKGYKLPAGFKQSWIKYQKSRASNWSGESNYYYYYDYGLTQAYRLYTLALAGEPEMGAMNRLREKSNNSLQSKWMLAASYVLAGQPEIAKQLTMNLSTDIKPYWETGYTYGTDLRDKAMILETYSLMQDFAHGSLLAEDIAKKLSSDEWYGTHTLAYCLIAFSKYAKASNLSKGSFEFAYKIDNDPVTNVSSKNTIYQVKPEVKNKSKINLNIVNKNKGALYVRFYREGIPIAGFDKDAESDLTLRIVYKDMKGNLLNVENMNQGTDFKAEVTINNTNAINYVQNLALTQIVPSGWEIINTRLADMTAAGTINIPDYQDIRDDRIMSFFDLKSRESKTFTFLFNSTYLGEYYMPSVNCEAMYDHRIYARKAGKWVKVEK